MALFSLILQNGLTSFSHFAFSFSTHFLPPPYVQRHSVETSRYFSSFLSKHNIAALNRFPLFLYSFFFVYFFSVVSMWLWRSTTKRLQVPQLCSGWLLRRLLGKPIPICSASARCVSLSTPFYNSFQRLCISHDLYWFTEHTLKALQVEWHKNSCQNHNHFLICFAKCPTFESIFTMAALLISFTHLILRESNNIYVSCSRRPPIAGPWCLAKTLLLSSTLTTLR